MKQLFFLFLLVLSGLKTGYSYNAHDYTRFLNTGNCVNCDLSKGQFNGMDLTGADLRGSDLSFVGFRGAILKNVRFFGATFMGTDFSEAWWVDGSLCQQDSIDRCVKKN